MRHRAAWRRSRGCRRCPSRAARWISWIASRSKMRRLAQAAGATVRCACRGVELGHQYSPGVVDVEVVEPARRAVAAEVAGVAPSTSARSSSPRSSARVLVAHLLLDAVGAEARDRAAHVQVRLVDRVAERLARVAADDEPALLRHERAHVPDRAAHHDVHALHRDPAARRRVAADHDAARRGRWRRPTGSRCPPRRPSPDMMFSAHAHARVAVHADGRLLVHAGAVVAGVALDLDLDRRVDPDGDRVRAARVEHAPAARRRRRRPRAAPRSARAAG